jgi:biotin operon repressor
VTVAGVKPGSQCARIVEFLSDCRPHSMQDVHRAVGFCRLNSRVSELRHRGYQIECRREGGDYIYTLVSLAESSPSEATSVTAAPDTELLVPPTGLDSASETSSSTPPGASNPGRRCAHNTTQHQTLEAEVRDGAPGDADENGQLAFGIAA